MSEGENREIYLLLPAYNEGGSLPILLPRIADAMDQRGVLFHVVVVDDGSTDNTAEVLKEFPETLSLNIVTHYLNRGLGETERDGFEFVAGRCDPQDVIVRVEGDDTHDPKYIFALIDKLDEGFDVVNTSRFQPGGGQHGVNLYRRFISRAANLFMKTVFRISGVHDYSCGFRAYRACVIQDAIRIFGNNFIQLKGMGFTSTLETIVKLNLMGCRFSEVPFVLRYDRKNSPSKMLSSVTTLGYLLMALLCYWPFGGWLKQYRGLRNLYPHNPKKAIEDYGHHELKKAAVSQINL